MVLPLLAAGAVGIGSLLGGRKRNKAARKARNTVDGYAVEAINQTLVDNERLRQDARDDQARAIAYREQDEARLKAASGIDLVKLRDDAVKAGFNPLTVLNATGGAAYDGRGAVLTTPFISTPALSIADARWNRVKSESGMSGAVIETSGYFGDALSAGGSAFVSAKFNQQQLANDRMIAQAAVNNAGSRIQAQAVQSGGRFPQQAAVVDARPASGPTWWDRVTGAAEKFLDRELVREPLTDTPMYEYVDDGRGNRVLTPSSAIYDDGPMAWIREYVSPLQLGAMQWADQFRSWQKSLDAMRPPSDGKTPDEVYTPWVWPSDPAF